MNNKELELKIKAIIKQDNMFDMIMAAKSFEKDYKASDFYKEVKIPLMEIIKDAKMFYIKDLIQQLIDGIDMEKIETVLNQIADVYGKENQDTLQIVSELKDFKNIINK